MRRVWELDLRHFLAGDLNSQEDQEAYLDLTGSGDLRDTFNLVEPSHRYGNTNTATGFGYDTEPPKRIDFVLIASGEIRNGELMAILHCPTDSMMGYLIPIIVL